MSRLLASFTWMLIMYFTPTTYLHNSLSATNYPHFIEEETATGSPPGSWWQNLPRWFLFHLTCHLLFQWSHPVPPLPRHSHGKVVVFPNRSWAKPTAPSRSEVSSENKEFPRTHQRNVSKCAGRKESRHEGHFLPRSAPKVARMRLADGTRQQECQEEGRFHCFLPGGDVAGRAVP